jgi:hypothetical protein
VIVVALRTHRRAGAIPTRLDSIAASIPIAPAAFTIIFPTVATANAAPALNEIVVVGADRRTLIIPLRPDKLLRRSFNGPEYTAQNKNRHRQYFHVRPQSRNLSRIITVFVDPDNRGNSPRIHEPGFHDHPLIDVIKPAAEIKFHRCVALRWQRPLSANGNSDTIQIPRARRYRIRLSGVKNPAIR